MAKGETQRGDVTVAAYYEAHFERDLVACAENRFAQDPQIFLFHARRALEGGVSAVYAAEHGPPPAGKSVEDLLKELVNRGTLSRPKQAEFELIRTHANPAAHVPAPSESIDPEAADKVAQQLEGLIDWVVGKARSRAPELETRLARTRAHLRGEPRLTSPRDELEELRRERSRVCAELERHRRDPAGAQRSGAGRGSGRQTSTPKLFVPLVFLAMGAGAAAGWVARDAAVPPSADAESAPEEVAAHPVMGFDESAAASASDADTATRDDASAEVPAEPQLAMGAPSELDCPDGMTIVHASSITLGPPPDRPHWVSPTAPARENSFEAFCIAAQLVSHADYERCQRSEACPAPRRCAVAGGSDSPMTCVPQPAAAAYCRHRYGDRAALPSVLQLEIVARDEELATLLPAARPAREEYEWAADACPSPALGAPDRARPGRVHASLGRLANPPEEPRPRLSWHCQRSAATALHRFRCVAPALAADTEEDTSRETSE